MTQDEVRAMFVLAGIAIERVWRLPNGYMGDLNPLSDEDIAKDTPGVNGYINTGGAQTQGVVRHWMHDYAWRHARPAWLVKTPYGLIEIVHRKRVYHLDWRETAVRAILTDADVTKGQDHVHAYTDEELLAHLKTLSSLLRVGAEKAEQA